MLKCAIYARVSTDEQGTSIINQQEYFKDYIQRNKYEIFDIYTDEAFSGTETTKRLSFQRLLQDGKNKKYDVLLAKSYSRFGRNQRETLTALAELFENGIRIIFVEDGLDSLKDKGQFGLFAWLAEQESRKISERIKMTWQLYNKEGKIHTTTAPFGYTYSPAEKNFIVNPDEAEVVKMIFDMYLKGNGTRKIMVYLNNNGYITNKNNKWNSSVLCRLLTNEAYIGSLVQGKVKSVDVVIKKNVKADKTDWIIHKNNHEAIISENDFYIVQELFEKRSQYVIDKKRSRHSNVRLFSNLIKCSVCGSSFTYISRKHEKFIPRYSCIKYELQGMKECGHRMNSIKEKILIDLIKSALEEFSGNNFKSVKDYYKQKKQTAKNPVSANDLKKIDKKIEEKTNLSLSLLTAYTKGIVGDTQYKLQNNAIEKDLKILMEQKENIIAEQNKYVIQVDDEKETIDTIKELLGIGSEQWTNEMMKRLIDKIEVDMTKKETIIFFKFQLPKL